MEKLRFFFLSYISGQHRIIMRARLWLSGNVQETNQSIILFVFAVPFSFFILLGLSLFLWALDEWISCLLRRLCHYVNFRNFLTQFWWYYLYRNWQPYPIWNWKPNWVQNLVDIQRVTSTSIPWIFLKNEHTFSLI